MNRPTTFCVIHDREWTGEQGEACPWCKIERLRAVIRDAYIEGHEGKGGIVSTTHNDMPMCECPRCGHKWQQDDWYDVKAGDDWDCPKCEATLVVADVWQTVTVHLKAADAAEGEEG